MCVFIGILVGNGKGHVEFCSLDIISNLEFNKADLTDLKLVG